MVASTRRDARINIEQHRDEHWAARMGEGASSSGVPHSSTRGGLPLTFTPGGTSCRAFKARLRNIRWPPKFHPNLTEKYDGSTIIMMRGATTRSWRITSPWLLKVRCAAGL